MRAPAGRLVMEKRARVLSLNELSLEWAILFCTLQPVANGAGRTFAVLTKACVGLGMLISVLTSFCIVLPSFNTTLEIGSFHCKFLRFLFIGSFLGKDKEGNLLPANYF
jgi:hypothetical protein